MLSSKKLVLIYVLICLVMAGCASNPSVETKEPEVSNTPVKLTVTTTQSVSITDGDFQKLFVEPVKAKYPNITLELIKRAKGSEIPDLIAAGSTPDIILAWNGNLGELKLMDLLDDITPLVKKQNIDLGRFETPALDAIKVGVAEKGELFALPYAQQLNALYYNKDIFDKFGAPYPKDGMFWDDAVELAKKLTRTDNGVQYKGLNAGNYGRLAFPLSLSTINFQTNKADINSEAWHTVFKLTHDIYTIPGNEASADNDFYMKFNVAMLAGVNLFDKLAEAANKGFTNWDVAQYPSYKDHPNVYGKVDEHVALITKTSKHKEQAVQVLDVLTSDEVQLASVKETLRVSALKNPEINKQFGQDQPLIKDKHISSIYKSHSAPANASSPYNAEAGPIIKKYYDAYLKGDMDLNTTLRKAEEDVNQMLASK